MSAEPVSFCLRFKPPTLAIVYEIVSPHSPTKNQGGSPHSTMADSVLSKKKRRVHEIRIDDLLMEQSTSDDISDLCDMLLERESIYLDPSTISK